MVAGAYLVHYDTMIMAINAANSLDEVKDIRDKALALAVYAAQAKDTEAERRVTEIRIRAERRAGELLRETPRAAGAREPGTDRGMTPSPAVSASPTLASQGISYNQAARWQKLAEIPAADFEATFANPDIPSTSGIIREHSDKFKPAPEPPPKPAPVDADSLWVWGRLKTS